MNGHMIANYWRHRAQSENDGKILFIIMPIIMLSFSLTENMSHRYHDIDWNDLDKTEK